MSVTEIQRGVHRIGAKYGEGLFVFLYVVKGDRLALIDTGTVQHPQAFIQPALAQLGMALSDVDLILNTHAHFDHVGGNLEVKRASDARIYVHSGDAAQAGSIEAQVEYMTAPLRALGLPDAAVRQRADFVRAMAGEAAGADVMISEGDAVDLGGGITLKAIHTPGHTPGCISYYWESEGVLFSGDAIQGLGGTPGDTPYYFDACSYRRTLSTVLELKPHILCTGHAYFMRGYPTEPTLRGADAKAFLDGAVELADTIHRAVEAAVSRMPRAAKGDIALEAMWELAYRYPLRLMRETRLPRSAGPTLLTHIEAVLAGSYPA